MANNKAFKVKNGLQAGRYLLSNGVETIGSVGYNLTAASYDNVSFSVSSQATSLVCLAFKTDGTKAYISQGSVIYQYSLSTAWDLSTASYDSVSKTLSRNFQGLLFKPDGTKLFISAGLSSDSVYQYDLSTAWDLSTATEDTNFLNAQVETNDPRGLAFNADGTALYVVDPDTDSTYQYSLSTAYDVSTGTYSGKSFSTTETEAKGLSISSDGSTVFIAGNTDDAVKAYYLSTPYDLSSAVFSSSFDISGQATGSVYDIVFSADGTKMYIADNTSAAIYQYSTVAYTQTLDLSTGTTFAFTPSGATTVSFTNPPASGLACAFTVEINGDGSAITWPDSVKWHKNQTPASIASKGLYTFITTDGGTTYYGKRAAGGLA